MLLTKNCNFSQKFGPLLSATVLAGLITGCTTMTAHTSIEPYTKNKLKRNAVESIAETYCRMKRGQTGDAGNVKQPDFIFTTDGCSRTIDDSWKACCIVHDIPYWCGGSAEDRLQADRALMKCVNDKAGGMGSLFYAGVRMAGSPWLPTPWRWGYGWDDWPRGYETLESSPSVEHLLDKLKIYEIVEDQLQEKR